MNLDLFVYGTLREGQPLHALICPYILHSYEAATIGSLWMHPSGIPFAEFGPFMNAGWVHGEVYTVPGDCKGVQDVIDMEAKAGYEPLSVPVYRPIGTKMTVGEFFTGERIGDAIGFHHPWFAGMKRINHGDFTFFMHSALSRYDR